MSQKAKIITTATTALALVGATTMSVLAATDYTIIDPSTTNWTNARSVAVSGGYTTTDTSITLNIDNTKANSAYFLDYEGVATTLDGNPSDISGDLYLDESWDTNVRVSFWGYGYDTTDTVSAYGVIEYSNITDQSEIDYIKNHNSTGVDTSATCAANNCSYGTGWNVYDYNVGVWHYLPDVSATAGTHTLEFDTTTTGTVHYLIDGVVVFTMQDGATSYFGNITLEAMNAIAGFSNNNGDYSVTFTHLGYGTASAPLTIVSEVAPTLEDAPTLGGQAVQVLSAEDIATIATNFTGEDRVLLKSLENPTFLELDNDAHWTGSASITLSGLTPSTVYQLYHYDDGNNLTLEGDFDSDASGNLTVTVTAFSGNIIAETSTKATSTPTAPAPLVPNTGNIITEQSTVQQNTIIIATIALLATTTIVLRHTKSHHRR